MFRKRRGVPDWAVFFTDAQWREFERVVRAEITPRGISGDIRNGQLTYGKAKYGLGNLAQMCHAEPRQEEWPAIVARHFQITDDLPDGISGTPKVRLVDDQFMAQLPGEYVTRRVAEDLMLVLSWDLPEQVMTPSLEEVLEHGEPNVLFADAIEHTRTDPDLELERLEIPAGDETAELLVLNGPSFFTATHVLWADELDPPAPEHGMLVAVPNRHTVLAHAIRDPSVLGVIGPLLTLAQRLEQEGPGSISPHLYWLRDGELERLDAWIDDEGLHVAPSEAFTTMLEDLV